jgi:hypothetical protein
MPRSSVPLTKEQRIRANEAFKNETGNLFRILKNAFEKVIDENDGINLIIAVNQIPSWSSFRVPKRVAYYITIRPRYDYRNDVISKNLDVKAYVHDIDKSNKKKDLAQKYQVMIDWRPYEATSQTDKKGRILSLMGTGPGKITRSTVKDDQFKSLMNFFIYDEKILTNIDSITTIDRDTHFAKFIYDKDIRSAPKFEKIVKKAIEEAPKRRVAEEEGRPDRYFQTSEQQQLLDEMENNPEGTLNLFGRKNKSRKLTSRSGLTKLTKTILRIEKVIREN